MNKLASIKLALIAGLSLVAVAFGAAPSEAAGPFMSPSLSNASGSVTPPTASPSDAPTYTVNTPDLSGPANAAGTSIGSTMTAYAPGILTVSFGIALTLFVIRWIRKGTLGRG